MIPAILSALLFLAPGQTPPVPPVPAPAAAKAAEATPKALSFISQRVAFKWDQLLPLNLEVDGLKINSIFFNRRELRILKDVQFGTRAQIEVTNTSPKGRRPGFAVAVFDKDDRLLGVASGGPRFGSVGSTDTDTFDLGFSHVVERLPNGAYFILSIELSN